MPQHRIRVLEILDQEGDTAFQGVCSCGFVTPNPTTKRLAMLELNYHLVSSLKRAQADPNQLTAL